MQKRFLVKINKAREIFKRLISQGWRKLNKFVSKNYLHKLCKTFKTEFKEAIL